jgi:hydroxymethylpyrimidine/phosphomethylpyrimidine kinase
MGNVVPDRLFWAQPEADEGDEDGETGTPPAFDLPSHETKH